MDLQALASVSEDLEDKVDIRWATATAAANLLLPAFDGDAARRAGSSGRLRGSGGCGLICGAASNGTITTAAGSYDHLQST